MYQKAKKDYIIELANKWRGQITERVYESMYNYKIEIKNE